MKAYLVLICSLVLLHALPSTRLKMRLLQARASYLQLQMTSQLKIASGDSLSHKDSSYITAQLLKKAKKRYGKDGRRCANVFVVSGVMYRDCTNTQSPDGKNTGREWCYIDPREGGSPNWQYCAAILDYDKVRKKAKEIMEAYIPDIRKVAEVVQQQQGPTAKIDADYEGIVKIQSVLDVQTGVAEKQMGQLEEKMGQLVKMRKQWEAWEAEIKKLKGEIEELKKLNMDESPANCEGMLGYEQENPGDGLIGEYYNNEDFVGSAITKEDDSAQFEWGGQPPLKGIFPDNFSVRWTTYVKVPVTGEYTFILMSDDGSSLYLNGRMLISHFMGSTNGPRDMMSPDQQQSPPEQLSHLQSNFDNFEEGKREATMRKTASRSESVQLVANVKYKLSILYFHSVHNQFKEDGLNFLKLSWRSDMFSERVLHQDYLYQTPKQPPLKIYGYHSSWLQLFTLNDYDNAFIDTDQYKISDVPQQYQGLTMLKLPNTFKEPTIDIYANNPVVLFLATNMLKPNPLPEDFKEVGEVMSLLKISKFSMPENNKVKASQSEPMKIYSKAFPKGHVHVPLKVVDGKPPLNTFIMFYMLNPTSPSPLSCGGVEQEISKTDQDAYESCKASSSLEGGEYNCEYAFTGQMIDAPFKTWSSDGEGIGAWIEISFKKEYQVTRLLYKNREKSIQRSRELLIQFSNGVLFSHQVKNTDSIQKISFEPQIVKSIKVTIKSVYTSFNNGGSFRIYGLPCIDPLAKKENSEDDEGGILELKCKDSMVNNKLLEKRNYMAGDQYDATCLEPCADLKDIKVIGDMVYSEDSSICKAAEHMGVNTKVGKVFKVMVQRFRTIYDASMRNAIQSEGKQSNDGSKSISFEGKKDLGLEQLDNMAVGIKLDIYSETKKEWLPGRVVELERRAIDLLFVTVSLDGYDPKFNENIQYPNPNRLDYCANRITTRDDCDDKSKDPEKNKNKNIKICFGAGKDCGVKGYLLDSGLKKSKHIETGLTFGWDRDISQATRTRGVSQDPLLDNLILFPADSKSQWCLNADSNSKVPCLPAKWSIDLKNGLYDVKVTSGDPAFSAGVAINVNDQPLIDSQILKRNQYFTKSIVIQVSSGSITLDGICKASDCKSVWSRINTLEIAKALKMPENSADEATMPIRLGCGMAYAGQACEDGKQVENCIFDNMQGKGITNCSNQYQLVLIPRWYECKEQRDKFKCIKSHFKDHDHCKKNCPGKCKHEKCSVRSD